MQSCVYQTSWQLSNQGTKCFYFTCAKIHFQLWDKCQPFQPEAVSEHTASLIHSLSAFFLLHCCHFGSFLKSCLVVAQSIPKAETMKKKQRPGRTSWSFLSTAVCPAEFWPEPPCMKQRSLQHAPRAANNEQWYIVQGGWRSGPFAFQRRKGRAKSKGGQHCGRVMWASGHTELWQGGRTGGGTVRLLCLITAFQSHGNTCQVTVAHKQTKTHTYTRDRGRWWSEVAASRLRWKEEKKTLTTV